MDYREIKIKIEELITKGYYNESIDLLESLIEKNICDTELYSMYSVALSMIREYKKAIDICIKGLDIDPYNFDLKYNLACLYENIEEYSKAKTYFSLALTKCENNALKQNINSILNGELYKKYSVQSKIVFFVKRGLDSFLPDIINELSKDYVVKKVIVDEFSMIDKWMEWADICWFEWCDDLVIYGSKLYVANFKKIICRLHSYEAFDLSLNNINWNNIDKIIFVSEKIKNIIVSQYKIDINKTIVIPNGIDTKKYNYKNRSSGFNIAYIGYINYKKGPMLLLHTFKAIYDMDRRYKLYIAGIFQDTRDYLYFNQMIEEFGIKDNVIFDGWQEDLNNWLEDKNYILCTSLLESQNISVMQAMAKGIKPIIHNFVGAREIYIDKFIWNSIDEAIEFIKGEEYSSIEYRQFIEKNYSLENQIKKIKQEIFIEKIEIYNSNLPLVTVGITSYNSEKYIEECIKSILNQTYKNIEIIIVDDKSTDDTIQIINKYKKLYSQIKLIKHKKNSGGPIKGINEIIDKSNGKYYMWFAADDFLQNNTIERAVQVIEKLDIDYVYFNFNIVDENSSIKNLWRYKFINSEDSIKYIFNTQSLPIPFNGLFRKEFLTRNNLRWIKYNSNEYSSDTINYIQFAMKDIKYMHIDENLFNYRIHDNNESHNIKNRIIGNISVIQYIIEHVPIEKYYEEFDEKSIVTNKELKKVLAIEKLKEIKKNIEENNFPIHLKIKDDDLSDLIKYVEDKIYEFSIKYKKVLN